MDNPNSEVKKAIESEGEIFLIDFLLLHLRCDEEETNIVNKNDLQDLVKKRGIQYEENELNELLEILFNQQKEESQWEVYKRLVELVSNEGEGEEGQGEDQYQERQRTDEEEQYQKDRENKGSTNYNESKENDVKNTQEEQKREDTDNKEEQNQSNREKEQEEIKEKYNIDAQKQEKEIKYNYVEEDNKRSNNIKPNVIQKREIEIQKETNGIDNPFRQKAEDKYQRSKNYSNILSDLDVLSDNYDIQRKKNPKILSSIKTSITQLDKIDNQKYQNQQDYSNNPRRKSPYQSRTSPMKLNSVIQPINIFDSLTLMNKQSFHLFKENQSQSQLRSRILSKKNNELLYPINKKKAYQQPSSYSSTSKFSSINPREKIMQNRTFINTKDQDYFYSMLQNLTSNKKNMKILTDKMSNASSKPYNRKEIKDTFVVNKYKPAIQTYNNDYKAFTREYNEKMNPKQRQNFEYNAFNYTPSTNYLNQINLNYNYNNSSNVNDLSNQLPYSFKSKNYNLKDPKEKQMYIETLKKDLKEFTYQKEQIKKTRDDAFGIIDNQLEQLMKKPHFNCEKKERDDGQNQRQFDQNNEGINDDQVNQGYPNEKEIDDDNNNS